MATLELVEARIRTDQAQRAVDDLARGAERAGQRIGRSLDGSNVVPFTRNARGAATALSEVQRGAQGAERALQGVNRRASASSSILRSVAAAAGALIGTVAGISVGRGLVTINAQAQDLRRTLNATFQSADIGNFVFSELEKQAANSSQELTTLVAAVSQLQGSGFTAGQTFNQISELLTTLENGASLATNSTEAFQALVRVISRSTSGGLGLEELNQIFERIPGLQVAVEQSLGIVRSQFSELGKTAEGAGQIVNAIIVALGQGQFAGAAQNALGGITQSLSNLSDSVTAFFTRIGEGGFNEAFTRAVQSISGFITANQALATSIGSALGSAINKAVDLLEEYGTQIAVVAAIPLASSILSLSSAVGGALVGAINAATGATIAFGRALLLTPIGLIVSGIAAIVSGVTLFIQNILEANGITASFTDVLFALADLVGDGLVTAFDFAHDAVVGVADYLSGTFTGIVNRISGLITDFKNTVVGAFNSILQAGDDLFSFFGGGDEAVSGFVNRVSGAASSAVADAQASVTGGVVDAVGSRVRERQNARLAQSLPLDPAFQNAINPRTSRNTARNTALSTPVTTGRATVSAGVTTGGGIKKRVEDPLEDITREISALEKRSQTEAESRRFKLDNLLTSQRDLAILESTLPLEAEKKTILEEIARLNAQGVDTTILSNRISLIDQEIAKTQELETQIQDTQRTFEFGWQKATADAIDRATNFAQTAEDLFNTLSDRAADTFSKFATEWDGTLKGALNIFGSFVDSVVQQLTRIAINDIIASSISGGGATGIGNIISAIFSEKGNVFQSGNVKMFANGGILNTPTSFPLRDGLGIAGEAGPEGILPLKRDSQGRLGVINTTGSNRTGPVTINISTPDVRSFQRAQSEIQRELLITTRRGQRNG